MKAKEIIEGLNSLSYPVNDPDTCDTCKAGDPDREVAKVAVAMTGTPNVIREAAAWGADLMIVHEPLYYNHFDEHSDEPLEVAKRKLLEDTGMTVYRYHDYTHAALPDIIVHGELKALALDGEIELPGTCDRIRVRLNTPMTPVELAKLVEERLHIGRVRISGTRDLPCTTVTFMGGATDVRGELRDPESEIVLIGETGEWCCGEYARDAAEMGIKKALLFLGHISSERDGMVYTAELLRDMFPALDIRYFECGEVYTYTDSL
jgi:putative NIF3 family GTP cyclohydrolase 1 type 2